MSIPVCANCEHLMSYLYRKRCTKFCCGHKAINEVTSSNSIGATIYALPEYVRRPTIKTSPKWCPLRSGGENRGEDQRNRAAAGAIGYVRGGVLSERAKVPDGASDGIVSGCQRKLAIWLH